MIESIVATLALKGGGRLIRAAVESRDLGSADAAEVASAFLEAVVAGQRKADADLQRIEQKVDQLSTAPYHAAMTSGSLLLSDAAPTHRRPDDRRQLLFNARKTFANAVGHAHGRPLDVARALVMYGMAGAALGSDEDLASSLDRATRILQFEVLTSFQLDCKWNREQEARRAAPATKWREAILGPSSSQPDWSASNRWYRATDEYDALWNLRMAADKEPGSCPRLPRPHGTAYSHPRPGLPVRIDLKTRTLLLDTWLTLDTSGLSIDHRGDSPVRAAVVPTVIGDDRVVSPDVSALDQGVVVQAGTRTHLPHSVQESGRTVSLQAFRPLASCRAPAACLSFGRAEQVDLAVLLHGEDDWTHSRSLSTRPT